MIFQRFFAPRPTALAGRALFAAASAQARDPAFYGPGLAPDSPEGRFELYTLHVVMLLRRLSGAEPEVAEVRQGVFDAFVRNLDDGLREMGVGDLSVGKKMRKLASAVYGRLQSYNEALSDSDALAKTTALAERTLLSGVAAPAAAGLAVYILAVDRALDHIPLKTLLKGDVTWPRFQA